MCTFRLREEGYRPNGRALIALAGRGLGGRRAGAGEKASRFVFEFLGRVRRSSHARQGRVARELAEKAEDKRYVDNDGVRAERWPRRPPRLLQTLTSFTGSFCPTPSCSLSSRHLEFRQRAKARQLSSRSMFHAGRYLDDKEICYLGTVIVTADVGGALRTGHISALRSESLLLKPVSLLHSRSSKTLAVPKLGAGACQIPDLK